MSNAIYPSALPGLSISVAKTPIFATNVQKTLSGRRYALSRRVNPTYLWTLQYEFLRNTATFDELKTLVGFFNQRRGGWDDFLFTDPDDYTVTLQAIGVGTGAQTIYYGSRTWGGFTEPVDAFNAVTEVRVNNAVVSPANYTVDPFNGKITFAVAPANTLVITATFTYYWRVAFSDDTMEAEKFLNTVWKLGTVKLESARA